MRKARDGQPIPFSFAKRFVAEGPSKEYSIQVDFLTSTDEEMSHRHSLIEGSLSAHKARGCSIAFDHNMVAEIGGVLPGNGEAQTKMKMLDITGSIGMKGVVLGERYKEKDAYDIHSVVANCLDGPRSIAEEVRSFQEEGLVNEGISNIKEKFASMRAAGPSWVGSFLHPYDTEMRERAQAECFVKMREFLDALDLAK